MFGVARKDSKDNGETIGATFFGKGLLLSIGVDG